MPNRSNRSKDNFHQRTAQYAAGAGVVSALYFGFVEPAEYHHNNFYSMLALLFLIGCSSMLGFVIGAVASLSESEARLCEGKRVRFLPM